MELRRQQAARMLPTCTPRTGQRYGGEEGLVPPLRRKHQRKRRGHQAQRLCTCARACGIRRCLQRESRPTQGTQQEAQSLHHACAAISTPLEAWAITAVPALTAAKALYHLLRLLLLLCRLVPGAARAAQRLNAKKDQQPNGQQVVKWYCSQRRKGAG